MRAIIERTAVVPPGDDKMLTRQTGQERELHAGPGVMSKYFPSSVHVPSSSRAPRETNKEKKQARPPTAPQSRYHMALSCTLIFLFAAFLFLSVCLSLMGGGPAGRHSRDPAPI